MLSVILRDTESAKLVQLARLQASDPYIGEEFHYLVSWWTENVHLYHDLGYFQTWIIHSEGNVAGIIDIQWFCLNGSNPEPLEVPEIGYWVAQEFRGKGLATFALKSLIELYGYPSYQARVYKDNYTSQRVLYKCQFSSIFYNECTEHYLYQWTRTQ